MHCITIICCKPSADLIAQSGFCPWAWSLRLYLDLKVSKVSFLAYTSTLSRSPRQWRPSCAYKALHVLPALLCTAPDVCRRSSAAWLPPSSSHTGALGLAVSWLQRRSDDYVEWVKHFPSLKEIWSWIRNNLRLMNSTMISYVNSFPKIQPWFHDIIHSTEFTHEFIHMNSYMISISWIHQHEFRDEFIHMNSDTWFHNILHDHEFISEFISEFI